MKPFLPLTGSNRPDSEREALLVVACVGRATDVTAAAACEESLRAGRYGSGRRVTRVGTRPFGGKEKSTQAGKKQLFFKKRCEKDLPFVLNTERNMERNTVAQVKVIRYRFRHVLEYKVFFPLMMLIILQK